MSFITIRGATTVDNNSISSILAGTKELLLKIEEDNSIDRNNVISMIFTSTSDLDKAYPAKAARSLGYISAGLMCLNEMYVENSLNRCIRVMIFYKTDSHQKEAKHVYIKGAKVLRTDLVEKARIQDGKLAIAIDGPAGAGKSTIAKRVAEELSIEYIDTGAMYRALTLKVLEKGLDPKQELDVILAMRDATIDFRSNHIYLDGRNVDKQIRENIISKNVSSIAKIEEVRKTMVYIQQRLAQKKSVVMDGRDIATVVLPNADFKFFVTASVIERANRRYKELIAKEIRGITFEQIKSEIKNRDRIDSTREVSPLKKAIDAYELDTTNKSIEESVFEIISIIKGGN